MFKIKLGILIEITLICICIFFYLTFQKQKEIYKNKKYTEEQIFDMKHLIGDIYYDAIEGVLYYRDSDFNSGGYNPIYKADGSLKTINDIE